MTTDRQAEAGRIRRKMALAGSGLADRRELIDEAVGEPIRPWREPARPGGATDNADLWIAHERAQHAGEPAGIWHGIVVEEDDEVTDGVPDRRDARMIEADARLLDQSHAGVPGRQIFQIVDGSVRGPVIDDQQ